MRDLVSSMYVGELQLSVTGRKYMLFYDTEEIVWIKSAMSYKGPETGTLLSEFAVGRIFVYYFRQGGKVFDESATIFCVCTYVRLP